MPKTPTERLLECADEALALWSVAELFVNLNAELTLEKNSPLPADHLTKLNAIASAFALRCPFSSKFHKQDLTSGPRAKNSARMRRFRARKDAKKLDRQLAPYTEAQCREDWMMCHNASEAVFEAYKDKIVQRVNEEFIKIPVEKENERIFKFGEIFREINRFVAEVERQRNVKSK